MRIAVFQPPYPSAETLTSAEECLRWMQTRLDELKPGDHDLVLLPEYANVPGLSKPEQMREFAASQGARFLEAVHQCAKRLDCLIVLSGVAQCGRRWFNRSMAFDTTGKLDFGYDKLHLTDVESDAMGLTPGARPTVLDYGNVRIGLATCFDLYFPEHFESLAAQRADLVLCSSYQRSESSARIRLLARARAFDAGTHLIRSSYAMGTPEAGGHSLVATPAGDVLADMGGEDGVLTAKIDPARKLMKPRSHGQPTVEHRSLIEAHRRPEVYRPHPERAKRLTQAPFPRLCAHRGLSRVCPENTLAAFAAAVACGVQEIEFDLWTTRDGVPVVCHDEAVDRTTDGSGKIAELLWEDLRRLDAGVRFAEAWSGLRVPHLEELLDWTDGRVGLNIHIKDGGPNGQTIRRVCDLLTERALTHTAYLALGSESLLEIARDYAPEIPRACLVRQGDPVQSIAIAKRHACRRIQFSRQVTTSDIRQARDAGLICNLFWSDEPKDAMSYVQDGIDVILTNSAHTLMAAGLPTLRRPPAT